MASTAQRFLVGGEWRSSSATAEILDPFTNSSVGTVFLADEQSTDDAVEAGLLGFEQTKALTSSDRAQILSSISRSIEARKEEFADLITKESGKPIRFSRQEVDRAVLTFQLSAEEARRIGGEVVPLDLTAAGRNRFGIVRRFPRGIVLGISPFNFPLNLVAHKVGPAIASGNAVILKPPPQAPLTSLRLAEIVAASSYPAQALSVLPCTNDVAERLVVDERIRMLSFTGSARVGWRLKAMAGRKNVLLELGGNAGVIVDRGADLEDAAKRNVAGSFVYAGQVCIKVQRIFVHERIYDEYLSRFLNEMADLKVGDPQDPQTSVGPVIDDAAAERIESWIGQALEAGARILAGGRRSGRIIEPTVLAEVPRDAKVFCDEVFGPVVTLHRFGEIDEAIEGINDSPFGLQAGIFSNTMSHIMRAYERLEVGAVVVNDNPSFRVDNMPYGGVKSSGFGREGVRYAIEAMTEPRMLVLHS